MTRRAGLLHLFPYGYEQRFGMPLEDGIVGHGNHDLQVLPFKKIVDVGIGEASIESYANHGTRECVTEPAEQAFQEGNRAMRSSGVAFPQDVREDVLLLLAMELQGTGEG